MIGRAGDADAQAEVDFPFRRQIQIDGWKNLVLLKAGGQEIRGWTYGAIVFEASGDFLREVVAEFEVRRENETLAHRLAVQGFVESGIEAEIPPAEILIDDGTHLPGPGVGGELAALVADFIGKAEANRPFPFFRDGDAGTNVVADPLDALAAALGSEDIEADLEPVGETVGDLDGFVFGVVGGIEIVDDGFAAVDGEIAVELDHGVVRLHEIVAVNLDFVVVLRAGRQNGRQQQSADWKGPKQKFRVHREVLGINRKMRLTRLV